MLSAWIDQDSAYNISPEAQCWPEEAESPLPVNITNFSQSLTFAKSVSNGFASLQKKTQMSIWADESSSPLATNNSKLQLSSVVMCMIMHTVKKQSIR